MEVPSIAHPFTRDEVENFAQSVAPHVRLFMKHLCQVVAQDPTNNTNYNWSEEQVVEIQTLCDDVYFHQLLCHHLGDSSRSKNHTFLVTTRGINNIPLKVVSEFLAECCPKKKRSAAKSRKKPPPNREPDQATNVNTPTASQLVHNNPYPNLGNSPDDLPLNQLPHPIMMVPSYGYRHNTSGDAAHGYLATSQHSAIPSRIRHHNVQPESPGAATGRLAVPRANFQTIPGESLTPTWIDPGQQPMSTIPDTPPDSADFSTTTRLISGKSDSQQQGSMFPEHMGQSAIHNPLESCRKLPSEAKPDPHISHAIAASSSQSSHVLVPAQASNLFQPTHELPATISHRSTWGPSSSSCPENSNLTSPVAPVPTRRSTQKNLAVTAAGGTYHQRQPASSSSHFDFPNPSPIPSPYSTLLPSTLDATLWDVGTPLSSSEAPTPLDVNDVSEIPTASMILAENNAAAPKSQRWEYPPDISDPRIFRTLGSDHIQSLVGNTQQMNTWEKNPAHIARFMRGIAAPSGGESLEYGGPPTGHTASGNDVNQYVNEGRELEEVYARLTAGQRESDPKTSQKRKRRQEEAESNDSLPREVQATQPPYARNQKKRKPNI